MYMEDLDLNYRLAGAGWLTWYEPAATVVHIKAGTSGEVRNLRLNHAFHYGMYRFYRKHYAPERNPLAQRGRLRRDRDQVRWIGACGAPSAALSRSRRRRLASGSR